MAFTKSRLKLNENYGKWPHAIAKVHMLVHQTTSTQRLGQHAYSVDRYKHKIGKSTAVNSFLGKSTTVIHFADSLTNCSLCCPSLIYTHLYRSPIQVTPVIEGIFGHKITGWDPGVCKSNRLHVDVLRFSCIKIGGYILEIPLKWSVVSLQSWTSSTGSFVT